MTSTNEYISTKIIEVLSTAEHANKLHSLIGLHALLVKKYTEFEELISNTYDRDIFKNAYIHAFMSIEQEYNNIYRFIIADVQYLVWSEKSKIELYHNFNLIPRNNDNDDDNDNDDKNFEIYVDYRSLVQSYIDRNDFAFMHDNIMLDGTNNGLHILIKNEQLKSIKQLVELITIDWTITNKDGKTYLELARETKNHSIIEYIIESVCTSRINKLISHNEMLKDKQKELHTKNSELEKEIIKVNVEYHKQVNNLSTHNINKTLVILFMTVGWLSTLFYKSNL
jgi:hypothetical protein